MRTHRNRRQTSQLACVQWLIVAAGKLMAVYRPRLSTRHYQQDARFAGQVARSGRTTRRAWWDPAYVRERRSPNDLDQA